MMSHFPDSGFVPTVWLLPHPGTNGYVSTWGDMQSGTTPSRSRISGRPIA